MKILLVNPRYTLTDKITYDYAFPLGLAYIHAVIKKSGHEVDVLNMNHHDGSIEFILNKTLDKKNYDVLCTGHIGYGHAIVEKIIQNIKNHPSKPKIVMGGPIITTEPKLIFEDLQPDFGIIGEAEDTIVDLLDTLENNKDLRNVKGIIYSNNNELIFTEDRKSIENLDSIPQPDFEAFEYEKMLDNMSANHSPYGLLDFPRVYPILASRGCLYSCTFCYHAAGFRQRSIGNIILELKNAIEKYNINIVIFYDDLFSYNRERIFEFCEAFSKLQKELGKKVFWTVQLTVNGIDDGILSTMKEAGCYAISFGFESMAEPVLKRMKKPATAKLIDNAIKLLMKHKIIIQGNFIFGDKAETPETAKETLDYWKKNCNGQVYLGFVQPYPGSEMYDHCIKKGIIKDKLDFIKNHMSETWWDNMTDTMTDNEVLQLKKDVLEARRQHTEYVVPSKIKKEKMNSRYTLSVKCPFCKEEMIYKNFAIQDRLVFTQWTSCKECKMRFSLVSPIYKFGVQNYERIELLKKTYLKLKNLRLKKTM